MSKPGLAANNDPIPDILLNLEGRIVQLEKEVTRLSAMEIYGTDSAIAKAVTTQQESQPVASTTERFSLLLELGEVLDTVDDLLTTLMTYRGKLQSVYRRVAGGDSGQSVVGSSD